MVPPRLRTAAFALLFIVCYVALDWVSFVHPYHALNITPWNPALPLGLICVLRFGARMALPWFAALVLGDGLIRGFPASLPATAMIAAIMTGGYVFLAEAMRRLLSPAEMLSGPRNLTRWIVASTLGTLASSCLFVLLVSSAGLMPAGDRLEAVARYWIGDFVGIIATMPFFWLLFFQPQRVRAVLGRWETFGYAVLGAALLVGITAWTVEGGTRFFYLLFLPLAWAAVRQGAAGAALAAFLLQAGLIAVLRSSEVVDMTAMELQAFMAALATMGLLVGTVVDARTRTAGELARSLRLAAAGEMAGALAHELNQPITALSAYGTAVQNGLAERADPQTFRSAVDQMVRQAHHTAAILRRLRDFFETGSTTLQPTPVADMLESARHALDGSRFDAGDLEISPSPAGQVLIDRLQMQVVLRNLLVNACEASGLGRRAEARVHVLAQVEAGQLLVTVSDSGPGISPAAQAELFEPFSSHKANGLGLGLAISRSIAEAHGGKLTFEGNNPTRFRLSIPLEEDTD